MKKLLLLLIIPLLFSNSCKINAYTEQLAQEEIQKWQNACDSWACQPEYKIRNYFGLPKEKKKFVKWSSTKDIKGKPLEWRVSPLPGRIRYQFKYTTDDGSWHYVFECDNKTEKIIKVEITVLSPYMMKIGKYNFKAICQY